MSPSDSPDHLGSILYCSESSKVPYSAQTSNWPETFFAVSYSKPALVNSYFLLQARSAEVCADVLISNDLRGNDSHGVSNMLRKVIIESNQRNSILSRKISGPSFSSLF